MIHNKRTKIFLPFLLFAFTFTILSCTQKDELPKLVINEVLVNNESNMVDDYGQRSGWIEIFNRSFSDQDLGGWRIKRAVGNGNDTVIYIIPNKDVKTAMPPRQHLLFWADGKKDRGTFHMSFELDTLQNNWIGLYNQGDKLIDSITIRIKDLAIADLSYAREKDGEAKWVVKGGDDSKNYVTPSTNNVTQEENSRIGVFQENDKDGFVMTITAMGVVFSTLLLLYISFRFIGKYFNKTKTTSTKKPIEKAAKAEDAKATTDTVSDEVYAAIAMALHQATGVVHDEENEVLTITKISKHWNELID